MLIPLIGDQWSTRIQPADDPVRMELETAIGSQVAVLPVLIGNTPMPGPDDLPASLAAITYQNAMTVGVSRDFDTHMRALLPKIEAILGAHALQSAATADPEVISKACEAITRFLDSEYRQYRNSPYLPEWRVQNPVELTGGRNQVMGATLVLHRVARLAETLELHFILSFQVVFFFRHSGRLG